MMSGPLFDSTSAAVFAISWSAVMRSTATVTPYLVPNSVHWRMNSVSAAGTKWTHWSNRMLAPCWRPGALRLVGTPPPPPPPPPQASRMGTAAAPAATSPAALRKRRLVQASRSGSYGLSSKSAIFSSPKRESPNSANGSLTIQHLYTDELRARAQNPAPVGVVGVGRMGRGVVDQVATMTGLRVRALADLDVERAVRAFTENGWERAQVTVTDREGDAQDALRRGSAVATADPLLVPKLPLEAVSECTGDPETGARVAMEAIANGRHVVMLNVEADVVVGPILAEKARQAGVVYTLAAGDQPGAIFEMCDWATTLGFRIVCAGRGTVLFPNDHHATTETYQEIALRNRMNPKIYNEFRDGTKSQLEMVAVGNVLKLPPEVRGMHEPQTGWQELGKVFSLKKDGGILESEGVIDMANAVTAGGEYVHVDKVFPGVFVVVTSEHSGVRSSMAALFEPGFGGTAQQWGPNWGLFRPYHLACVEVPMSVARAVVQGRPTGDLEGGMVAELVAVAKRELAPGDELDGGGGYAVYGLAERYEVARSERLLPFGFAYSGRVKRRVDIDHPLTWDDVEVDTSSFLYKLRQEQDSLFA